MDKPEGIGMDATSGGSRLRSLEEIEPDGWYVQSECRSGCVTQDHASWGECARASRIGTGKGETTKGTM